MGNLSLIREPDYLYSQNIYDTNSTYSTLNEPTTLLSTKHWQHHWCHQTLTSIIFVIILYNKSQKAVVHCIRKLNCIYTSGRKSVLIKQRLKQINYKRSTLHRVIALIVGVHCTRHCWV